MTSAWRGLLLGALAARAAAAPCDVTDFGAKGDNITEDTGAVAAALEACAGGSVLLPAGRVFLLRPIELPSNTTLIIDGDVQAWQDLETWPNSTVRYCSVSP